jgi:hypothetical protein
MKSFLLFFALILALSWAGAVGLRRPDARRIDKSSVFSAPVQSQATDKRAGSITGRIVVVGNPAPGVDVMLLALNSNSSLRTPVANTKTDEHGRYQFKGVAPGSYDIFPSAPELVLPKQGRYGQPGKTYVCISYGAAPALTHMPNHGLCDAAVRMPDVSWCSGAVILFVRQRSWRPSSQSA